MFKVGDVVRVKVYEQRPSRWNSEGDMDKFMGTIQTISIVSGTAIHLQGDINWMWRTEDLMPANQYERSD